MCQDSNGYYLKQIKRKDGIMGKEYYLARIDIYIGDSDSQNTVIVQGVTFFEPVLLYSNKTAVIGDVVLLKNAGDFFVTKVLLAAFYIGILSLAGLLFLTVYADKRDYQELVLVVPDGTGLPILDLKEVNKLCTEELSITYDINKRVTAESANSERAVTLIGTNLSYADVMGLKLTAGSFWTEEAWSMASRYVVLNEPAAFQMFGSSSIIGNTVKFDGEVWLVTGVVKDGYKKKVMAYVPASAISGHPEALMVKTSGGNAAVLNSLNILDVYEGNCRAVDVEAVAGLFGQLFITAVDLVIVLAAIIFILSSDMAGCFALMLSIGLVCNEIGERIPFWNNSGGQLKFKS